MLKHIGPIFLKINWFIVFLVILSSLLILSNLDNSYLWQDEAETALLAKSILVNGIPKAFDGRNLISQELGREFDKNYTWFWSPWLSFYLTAISFSLFGITTFFARLPFALAGILGIILTYYVALNISKSERVARLSALFIVFCVPYLVYVRQCRYYSLLILFTQLTVLAYLFVKQGRRYASLLFWGSATLLFHSHYLLCMVLLAVIFFHWLQFHLKEINAKKMMLIYACIAVANWPWGWMFYHQISKKFIAIDLSLFMLNLLTILKIFNTFIFPWLVLAVFFAISYFHFKKNNPSLIPNLILLFEIIVGTILIISICLPGHVFFRYAIGIIPFLFIMNALAIDIAMKRNRILGISLFLLFCFINSGFPYVEEKGKLIFQPFPIKNYIEEITHSYKGPVQGFVKYLKDDANIQNKTIAITYEDLPLKFYTNAKVIGGLTGENLNSAKDADYVIIRKNCVLTTDCQVRQYFLDHVNFSNYERIELDYPDYPFENSPEPYLHQFTTPAESPIVIFKKKT